MNKRAGAWSDGCAACVRGGQIDFLQPDSSGVVAALGEGRSKRYVKGTWPNGRQEETEADHRGVDTEASTCNTFPEKVAQQ